MNKFNMKLQSADDLNVGGYGAPATQVPPPPAQVAPATPPAAQAAGSDDNLDEYGYEKVAATPTSEAFKEAAKPAATTPAEKIEEVAGYNIEPVKAAEVVTPPPAAAVEEIKLDYEVDVKDVPKADADLLKKFALENKLPKETAQALMDLKKKEIDGYKAEILKAETDRKTAIATQKASWDKELREDPVFGGEQFPHNIKRVNKVLGMMTETKKMLTERKSMLPPSTMRDLAKLHDHLFDTDTLVQGSETIPEPEVKASSPLDFYE